MIIVVDLIACSRQEAAESINFGRHVSNRIKFKYSEFSHQELSIGICMGPIGGGRKGGGVGGGSIDLWAFYMVALSGMLLVVFEICAAEQEGVGSITFGGRVQIPIKNYTFGNLTSRAIDWYVYESNWRGVGGSGGVQVFWTLPPKIYWVTPTKF